MPTKRPILLPRSARGLGLSERVIRVLLTCKHYTGLHQEHCAAGVRLNDVRVRKHRDDAPSIVKFPCLDRWVRSCPYREYRTVGEAEHEVAMQDVGWKNGVEAFVAVLKATHGRRQGAGKIKCPNCKHGMLDYAFAPNNGHLHAACNTDHCTHIME